MSEEKKTPLAGGPEIIREAAMEAVEVLSDQLEIVALVSHYLTN